MLKKFFVLGAFLTLTLQACGSGGGGGGSSADETPSRLVVYSTGDWGPVLHVEDAPVISSATSEEICALRNTRRAMRAFELSGRFSLPNGINFKGVSFITNANQVIPEVCFRDEAGVQSPFCVYTYADLPILDGDESVDGGDNNRYYTSFHTSRNGYIFVNRFNKYVADKASLYYYLATESVHVANMTWGADSLRDEVFALAVRMGCGGGGSSEPPAEDAPPEEEPPVEEPPVEPPGGGPENPDSGGGPVNPDS